MRFCDVVINSNWDVIEIRYGGRCYKFIEPSRQQIFEVFQELLSSVKKKSVDFFRFLHHYEGGNPVLTETNKLPTISPDEIYVDSQIKLILVIFPRDCFKYSQLLIESSDISRFLFGISLFKMTRKIIFLGDARKNVKELLCAVYRLPRSRAKLWLVHCVQGAEITENSHQVRELISLRELFMEMYINAYH